MHYFAPQQSVATGDETHRSSSGEGMSRTLQLALQESREITPMGIAGEEGGTDRVPQSALFPDGTKNFDEDEEEIQVEGELTDVDGINPEMKLSDLTDAQIIRLTQDLQEEESARRPLISPIEPLSELAEEYATGSRTVVDKLSYLERIGWRGVRRTRGDGDCFYRSLAFSYVERLLLAPDPALAVAMSLSTLQETRHLLDEAGFQQLVYEDFYDVLVRLISSIISPPGPYEPLLSSPGLLAAFQDAETSNSIVVYLRLLTSGYIRAHEEEFLPYLFSPDTGDLLDTRDFCEREVEASGKEADHVQEMALARALNLCVRIAYLDNSLGGQGAEGKVDFVTFESEQEGGNGMHEIALLYRPGHFDILETRDTE
ncbi:cysteine proteinase [Dacryopinax primogenitus]|uniref:ubiquitinyl hydrolase 1 n=1 Tax=Dacryopinax primogenitus (strain DJM 731) TaxID=1858805 RepID=M5G089_DACPD|nr:cysteine proteinase [Dacryopinax primogenitus]EJT97187.1 cysteine proteinase [Dacryopinax primogenitus]